MVGFTAVCLVFSKDDKPESLAELIDENTKAVYCESIGNPAGNIIDLERVAELAHAQGVPVIVDNTVATPVLCKPIEFGADIVETRGLAPRCWISYESNGFERKSKTGNSEFKLN